MYKSIIAFTTLLLFSCTTTKPVVTNTAKSNVVIDGKLWGAAYQQKAAEYAALCHQAYNAAAMSLDEHLKVIKVSKPIAVITDIDETVLDNSPNAVQQALQGKYFEPESWYAWTNKAIAKPVPGSLAFFNFAKEKNVTVFYLTNRDEKERAATLANLKKLNYPFADDAHLILKADISSKELRRQSIAEKYYIAMLIGDNLADFSNLWDKKSTTERMKQVSDNADLFGKRFIILPNINYGGWEDSWYENRHNLNAAQKDSAVKAGLQQY